MNKFSTILKGKFNANEFIDPAIAGRMLNISFLFGETKISRRDTIELRGFIEQAFREYESNDMDLLERKWEPRFVISFFYAMWKSKEIGLDKMYQLTNDVYKLLKDEGYKKSFYISFSRSDLVKLDKIVKEVLDYV